MFKLFKHDLTQMVTVDFSSAQKEIRVCCCPLKARERAPLPCFLCSSRGFLGFPAGPGQVNMEKSLDFMHTDRNAT